MANAIFNIFKNISVKNQSHTLIQHHWMNTGVKLDFWNSRNEQRDYFTDLCILFQLQNQNGKIKAYGQKIEKKINPTQFF